MPLPLSNLNTDELIENNLYSGIIPGIFLKLWLVINYNLCYATFFFANLCLLKRFLETNAGCNRIITRRQMEDYLESQGYQVEKKTLYIDLDYLQARFGLNTVQSS